MAYFANVALLSDDRWQRQRAPLDPHPVPAAAAAAAFHPEEDGLLGVGGEVGLGGQDAVGADVEDAVGGGAARGHPLDHRVLVQVERHPLVQFGECLV